MTDRNPEPTRSTDDGARTPGVLKTVLGYAVFAAVWIVTSRGVSLTILPRYFPPLVRWITSARAAIPAARTAETVQDKMISRTDARGSG